jgi:hypothetical protein
MKLTAEKIRETLNYAADTVSIRKGIVTIRMGFFFTHGFSEDRLVAKVKTSYPTATIIDSGEIWKPFRGGATVAQGSHWFVKFTIPEQQ